MRGRRVRDEIIASNGSKDAPIGGCGRRWVVGGVPGAQSLHIIQVPEPEASPEGRVVVSQASACRKILDFLRIPPAENYVFDFECRQEFVNDGRHGCSPGSLPNPPKPLSPQHLSEWLSLGETEAAEFQRHDGILRNQRRAKSRSQSQEQHAATLIASKGLHGSIVQNADRHLEGGRAIASHPARGQISCFGGWPRRADPAWIAQRDRLIFPAFRQLFGGLNQLRSREV